MMKLPTVVFMCTNGAGLGHVNRCLAYARRLSGQVKSVFFSLSSVIEIIESMGFDADYFVSYNWSRANSRDWNRELCIRFGMMLERVAPQVVVFDGTWPYQGFVMACKKYGKSKQVWSYRGLHQTGKEKIFGRRDLFSLVLRPGEVGDQYAVESGCFPGGQVRLPPVCILEDAELLDRTQARNELGMSMDRSYALLSLGAGNINDLNDVVAGLVRQIHVAGVEIVWAKNPISVKDIMLPDGIRSISMYPLARYLRAFDVLVGAAGYNTCCEVVQSQVPALLIPNMNARLDDQLQRAQIVTKHAPVIVSGCANENEQKSAVNALLNKNRYSALGESKPMNGAELAAIEILKLIDGGN